MVIDMGVRVKVRNVLASTLRWMPHFRGKGRVGNSLLRHLTDYTSPEECIVSCPMKDGTVMRIDLRSPTEKYAFWTGQYDGTTISRIARCLRPGSVAVDVGANIGFYSVALGSRLRALGGRLFAFEPVKSNYDRLVDNILLNRLDDTVRALDIALGEREGRVEFTMGDDYIASTGNAVVLGGEVRGRSVASARMARLDDVVREQGISHCDFIKVDIEGGELGFLRGGQSFIGTTRPLIYLELNHRWMNTFGWTLHDLRAFVSPLGYQVYRQVGQRFVPAEEEGAGVENGLLLPLGSPLEPAARRHLLSA